MCSSLKAKNGHMTQSCPHSSNKKSVTGMYALIRDPACQIKRWRFSDHKRDQRKWSWQNETSSWTMKSELRLGVGCGHDLHVLRKDCLKGLISVNHCTKHKWLKKQEKNDLKMLNRKHFNIKTWYRKILYRTRTMSQVKSQCNNNKYSFTTHHINHLKQLYFKHFNV